MTNDSLPEDKVPLPACLILPAATDARSILEKQKTISRSQYVFVRVGGRVDKDLWYTAPLSRHTLSQQFTKRRREMELPWDAVLHSTRHTAPNRPWRCWCGRIYNTSNRWTHPDYVTTVRAPGSRDDPTSRKQAWRVSEDRGNSTACQARNCTKTDGTRYSFRYTWKCEIRMAGKWLIQHGRKWRNWQTHQT